MVAVVGDGALTGGMAWEALNNIAATPGLRLVVVVNDNGRSYTPTVGGLANHLAGLRTDQRYEKTLSLIKRTVKRMPMVGRPMYDLMHGVKTGVKDVLAPQSMFSDLGIKYIGPIDGHDITALTNHLEQARHYGGPVIVHCVTRKGRGFQAAEENEEDRFHAVGRINEITGEPLSASVQATWTDAFAEAMVQIGQTAPGCGGRHRRDAAPDGTRPVRRGLPGSHLRRRHRRAARRRVGGRAGALRPAPGGGVVRHVPQPGLRSGAHGRRAARGRPHHRARPRRRHGHRRPQPQRDVGHQPAGARARAPAGGPA